MPLRKDKTRSAINYNIRELKASGRSTRQSIAIAYSVAGKSKRGKRGK